MANKFEMSPDCFQFLVAIFSRLFAVLSECQTVPEFDTDTLKTQDSVTHIVERMGVESCAELRRDNCCK